ncbi:PKD domain-containing protein [Micromonospora olivasterospora]|uniref:Putative repeat protein (TIGR01451 family) n=1 Tax=Micromonospora olivasterospora TaxID=1880 RepID=A0A562IA71_MICOL|nr:PKD domain-containing protein [Micromonospora olivasterospora]TWH67605.1 putative repeat protein (TIGR01451 family) [Micromonospora olivasterospora]
MPITLSARRRLAALLAGVVAAPLLGVVAAPPQAVAAPTTPTVTIVDLGVMGRLNDVSTAVGELNDAGLVAAGRWIEGVDSHTSALLLQAGKPAVDLHPLIPGAGGSTTRDVNDAGDAVGFWTGSGESAGSFLYRDGAVTRLDLLSAEAISDTGFVAGGDWVRDPQGKVLRLGSLGGGQTHADGVNDEGVVVGVSDTDPAPDVLSPRAFRTRPGKSISADDALGSPLGGRSQAFDVNDAGQVAGWGGEPGSGGHQPVVWQANGLPVLYRTSYGGEVNALNEAGSGVGAIRMQNLTYDHAALFQDGAVTDLNTLLPEGSDWELVAATGINDAGQISGYGRRNGDWARHAFVMTLGEGPVLDSVRVEHQEYPSGTWVDATRNGTTDGNTVRVTVRFTNRSKLASITAIELVDAETGEVVENGKRLDVLDPGESLTRQFRWDTVGLAWNRDGSAHPDPRRLIVRLRVSDRVRDAREIPLLVKPRPVILVHGYKSNATSSWGKYQPFLESAHPLLHGWAVGDNQEVGVLRTGSLDAPFERTNTISENARQEAAYIEGVRARTDAWHVDVVAHSMGGLISRWYVQELMPESKDARPVVNRLIMMGTPNMGSPCADLVLDTAAIAGEEAPLMPATQQLSTAYVATSFNPNITDRRGVTFSNMVGVGHVVPCYFHGVGDGVVTRDSARYVFEDVPESDTFHTSMTEELSDFTSYVLPRLARDPRQNDTPDRTNLVSGEERAPIVAPQGIGAAVPAVPAGATVDVPLDVPTGEQAGVVAMAPPSVGLTLLDSSGAERGSAPAAADADQPFRGLVVDDPAAGRWTLRLTNTGTGEARVPLSAWIAGNPLTVEVTAAQVAPDGTVRVSARLDDDGTAVPGADVDAVVLGERGDRAELALHDDGGHDDGAAGDGVYAGTTVLGAGAHSVVVTARSDRGTRVGRTAVEVEPVDTGSYTLSAEAGPGGQVTVEPRQDAYPAGTEVTLHAAPKPGFLLQGWTVDGKPAGATRDLKVKMDRDHAVVARFLTYAITDLGSLSPDPQDSVEGVALNDRGQVVGRTIVVRRDGSKTARAFLWEDGTMRNLGTLPCTTSTGADGQCVSFAGDINNDGVVVGTSEEVDRGSDHKGGWHAFRWADGRMTALPAMPDAVGDGFASAYGVNDDGEIVGYSMEQDPDWDYRWWAVRWNASGERVDATQDIAFETAPTRAGINASGAVVGHEYVPDGWRAAVWADGEVSPVAVPTACTNGSRAHDIADDGTVVGEFCTLEVFGQKNAFVSRNGRTTDLGRGIAYAVNESGLVVGTGQTLSWDSTGRAVLWQDGVKYELASLAGGACQGEGEEVYSSPCVGLTSAVDVNERGQILVNGSVTTRKPGDPKTVLRVARPLLLTPVTATADLDVEQAVSATATAPGAPVTWTTTVTNAGPDTATAVHLETLLPDGVTVTGCTVSTGEACDADATLRSVVLPELANGESVTLTVRGTVTAGPGATLTATARAWSRPVPDLSRDNDSATATTTVVQLLDKTALKFWDQRLGSTSSPSTVTLTNRTSVPLPVTGVSATGDFAASTGCPAVLAPGASCPVQVMFTPTTLGTRTGTVKITTEVGTLTVAVDGNGIAANARPVVTSPAPVTVPEGSEVVLTVPFTDADTADTHTAQVVWPRQPMPGPVPAKVVERDGSGTVTATWTYTDNFSDTAAVIVTDSKGEVGFAPAPFTVVNVAPTVSAGPDATLEPGGTLTRNGSVTDPSAVDAVTATVDYGDGTGAQPLPLGADRAFALSHGYAAAGTYTVTVTARDDDGGVGTARFTVTVRARNEAPHLEWMPPAATPAEGEPLSMPGSVTDPDGDPVTVTVDYGDGTDPGPVEVRDGRFVLDHTYAEDGEHIVTLRADDGRGGTDSGTVRVVVLNAAPRVRIDAPTSGLVVPVGTEVRLAGSFTDAGRKDTHTARWLVDGAAVPGVVDERDGSGTVTAIRRFTEPGVYPLQLTVTDDEGGSGSTVDVGDAEAYVVVYDPDGGFVTGGVRLTVGDQKASLGFVARYAKDATTPGGETQLAVRAAGLDLHSTSYEWLTVGSGRAQYRGAGTLGGRSGYAFLVSVVDGAVVGGPDRIRVRVWEVATGTVVYDTQPGAPLTADPTTAIDGGNLVVHP